MSVMILRLENFIRGCQQKPQQLLIKVLCAARMQSLSKIVLLLFILQL